MGNQPNLTPAELERLALLAEECGEVIQVIGKIQRHGYESSHSDYDNISNRLLLQKELGHVKAVEEMMLWTGDIVYDRMLNSMWEKLKKVQKFLHWQPAKMFEAIHEPNSGQS